MSSTFFYLENKLFLACISSPPPQLSHNKINQTKPEEPKGKKKKGKSCMGRSEGKKPKLHPFICSWFCRVENTCGTK